MIHSHHPAITIHDTVLLGEILLRESSLVARVTEVLAHQLGHPVICLVGAGPIAGGDAGDDEGHFAVGVAGFEVGSW